MGKILFGFGITFLLAQRLCADAQYQVSEIPLVPGSTRTGVMAVNTGGQIVVDAFFSTGDIASGDYSGVTRPFLMVNGSYQPLSLSGGYVGGEARGMNDAGDVVGFVTDSNGAAHPALWSGGGGLAVLDTGSTPEGIAFSINNHGEIAGGIQSEQNSNFVSDAAVWKGGILSDLGRYGGGQAHTSVVNGNGQSLIISSDATTGLNTAILHSQTSDQTITSASTVLRGAGGLNNTGTVIVTNNQNANYLWNGEIIQSLEKSGSSQPDFPWAINDEDSVVGFSTFSDGQHALLWQDGQVADLNMLLGGDSIWQLQIATDISNGGFIVGTGVYQGQESSFLLTPLDVSAARAVPEAGTFGVVVVGVVGLLRRRRGKK